MAALRPVTQPSPVWGGRLAEWGVLLLLAFVLGAVFVRQMREVRGQAELAQIKSTLGALRTALVVAHLEGVVAGNRSATQLAVPQAPSNPFLALSALPANYAGLADAVTVDALAGGNWAFNPTCACIGYKPIEAERLESPIGAQTLWFQVSRPPGPLQISPQLPYVWMGQLVE